MVPRKVKKVYVQHFNERVKIEEKFTVANEKEGYIYQISYKGIT